MPRRVSSASPPLVVRSTPAAPSNLGLAAGRPLDPDTRQFMQARIGADFSSVQVHTDRPAARLNRDLGSAAFTHGRDIYFGDGRLPGKNALTAHELTHVVQQSGGLPDGSPIGRISPRPGERHLQCSFTESRPVPGSRNGLFEIDLVTREGALNAASPMKSGLDGSIRFVPSRDAPNANQIVMVQIAKTTDLAGNDINAWSEPEEQAQRGVSRTSGLHTADAPARGIEGGFATDVEHRASSTAPPVPQDSPLSPRYPAQPAPPGAPAIGGSQTRQLPQYGGGLGAVTGQTAGFKRSSLPADIRSAAMYDFPGSSSASLAVDFAFETVVVGEDTMFTYGAVTWGFGLRAGRVVNEHLSVQPGQSATFGEALERHREFYVHEPVTLYFDFDSDRLPPVEAAKIDACREHLRRNPDVVVDLEGYADVAGRSRHYNLDLSRRRIAAAIAEMTARGIDRTRIRLEAPYGPSTAATRDAGTGDQGGNARVARDQSREENRWANRRVVLNFSH